MARLPVLFFSLAVHFAGSIQDVSAPYFFSGQEEPCFQEVMAGMYAVQQWRTACWYRLLRMQLRDLLLQLLENRRLPAHVPHNVTTTVQWQKITAQKKKMNMDLQQLGRFSFSLRSFCLSRCMLTAWRGPTRFKRTAAETLSRTVQ